MAVTTTKSQADPSVVGLARSRGAEVVVLPLRVGSDGGVYTEGTLMLVKSLRAAGVTAAYLHDPEGRKFEARKSAVSELVWVPLAVGVLSSASWDLIRRLLLRVGPRRLRVDYTSLEQYGAHATTWSVTGDAKSVLDAIERLRDSRES